MATMWKFGGMSPWGLARRMWERIGEHRVLDQSAMLAFYSLFAVFPFLLFLVSLLGIFLHSGQALHDAIQKYLTAVAPASASGIIETTLRQISRGSGGGAIVISLLFSLWVASSGLVAAIEALNIAYEVKESRSWWKRRVVALGLTVGLAIFLGGALLLLGFGDNVANAISGRSFTRGGWMLASWSALKWILLLVFLLAAFNLLYLFAPNVKRDQWHWLMPGTVLAVSLWLLISYGLKIYLSVYNTYNRTYGSIAAVIILLLWFYLSSIAVLAGGEMNSEIEKRSGRVKSREDHTVLMKQANWLAGGECL